MKKVVFNENFKQEQNYYSLIIAISKVARNIVKKENEVDGNCPDNPVQEAINFLKTDEFEIVQEDEEVEG